MDVGAYLARIDHRGNTAPTREVLADLQRAHLLAVPFENLSIHIGEPIELRVEWLWDKLIVRRRGGFCYELNGLFAELLVQLGFEVDRLSARVYGRDGQLGIPFDHMCLRVRAGGADWLTDVGFGDNFIVPLRLDDPAEQTDGRRPFRIERDGDDHVLWGGGERSYRFDLTPYALTDFAPGCEYHQTSPQSHFTRGRVISRLTADGRLTLRDDRLITTEPGGEKREQPVTSDTFGRLAAELFGLALPPR